MQTQEFQKNVNEITEEEQNEDTKSEKSVAEESLVRMINTNWVGAVMNISALSHFHYKSGKGIRKDFRVHPICRGVVLKVLGSDFEKFGMNALTNSLKIRTDGLVDSGAQMVLIGLDVLKKLGVRKSELLKVKLS